MDRYSSHDSFRKWLYDLIIVFQSLDDKTPQGTAILLCDDHIRSHVYQPSGKVTSISSFQCGIRKTFTGSVRRDKVLQYIKPLLKVGKNRVFDDLTHRSLKVF